MNLKKIVIGYLLITYGIFGELLPVLEGIVFVTIGLLLLKNEVKWVNKFLFEWTEKHPILSKPIQYLSDKIDSLCETLGLSNKDKK